MFIMMNLLLNSAIKQIPTGLTSRQMQFYIHNSEHSDSVHENMTGTPSRQVHPLLLMLMNSAVRKYQHKNDWYYQ